MELEGRRLKRGVTGGEVLGKDLREGEKRGRVWRNEDNRKG